MTRGPNTAHATVFPGPDRATVTWFIDGRMDRAENYDSRELALARARHGLHVRARVRGRGRRLSGRRPLRRIMIGRAPGLRLQIVLALAGVMLVAYVPLFFAIAQIMRGTSSGYREDAARSLGRAVAAHVAAVYATTPALLDKTIASHRGAGGAFAIAVFDESGGWLFGDRVEVGHSGESALRSRARSPLATGVSALRSSRRTSSRTVL